MVWAHTTSLFMSSVHAKIPTPRLNGLKRCLVLLYGVFLVLWDSINITRDTFESIMRPRELHSIISENDCSKTLVLDTLRRFATSFCICWRAPGSATPPHSVLRRWHSICMLATAAATSFQSSPPRTFCKICFAFRSFSGEVPGDNSETCGTELGVLLCCWPLGGCGYVVHLAGLIWFIPSLLRDLHLSSTMVLLS